MEDTVSHSLCLIAAAVLAGQAPDGRMSAVPAGEPVMTGNPGCSCNRSAQMSGRWQQSWSYSEGPRQRDNLFSRIAGRVRDLFGAEDDASRWQPVGPRSGFVSGPVAQPYPQAPGIVREPVPSANEVSEPPAVHTGGAAVPVRDVPSTNGPAPTAIGGPRSAAPSGLDADGNSIAGRLEYVTGSQGMWMVRYTTPGQEDQGGSVILSTVARMDSFRTGDFVRVRGEFLNDETGVGAPLFRAEAIELISHAE
jgi:hypothetical protein